MNHPRKRPWRWTPLLAALLCLMVATTAWEMGQVASHLRTYSRQLAPAYESAHSLSLRLQDMRAIEFAHAQASTETDRERLAQRMDELREAALRELDRRERELAPGDAAQPQQLRAVREALAAYDTQWQRLRPISRPGAGADPSTRAFEQARVAIDAWWSHTSGQAREQERRADADVERARLGFMGVVALALLLASGVAAGGALGTTRVDPERWASF